MRKAGLVPLALGILAAASGALFLADVGAIEGMASLNVAAYALGLPLGWAAHKMAHRPHGAAAIFLFSTLVLATTLIVGVEVDGVRRWLSLGPVNLQPGLVLAPLLLAVATSREGRHWRVATLLPLALIAAQPDGATSSAMAAGIGAAMTDASRRSRRGWSRRRIQLALAALALAALALLIAGIRTPPPVAFVEGTAEIAALSGVAAIALHLAAIVLAVAAMLSRDATPGLALAAYFATAILAALFWAFPMPIAGAAPSHMIGFGLAVGWLTLADRLARRRALS